MTNPPDLTARVDALIYHMSECHTLDNHDQKTVIDMRDTIRALSAGLEAERVANGHEKRLRLDVIAMEQAATARAEAAEAERDDQKKARLEAVRSWVNAEARAEAAVARRNEALNQLDSERHNVDVLESRVAAIKAELAEAVDTANQAIDVIASVQSYKQPDDPTEENALTMCEHEVFDFDVETARALLARHQKETGV